MWVDAHCHLTLGSLWEDWGNVVARGQAVGVSQIIMAGYDEADWSRQIQLLDQAPGVFGVFGLHPWVASGLDAQAVNHALDLLTRALVGCPAVVAIGETGLDRIRAVGWPDPGQVASFRAHLALARELNLPVVLHVVRAHGLALDILRDDGLPPAGGLVHSFSGHPDVARAYQSLGLYLSYSPLIQRATATKARQSVLATDPALLLAETDGPDQSSLADVPGEPAHLPLVLEEMGKLLEMAPAEVGRITAENARRLFGLTPV
jgi:TatD DNase family protein